VARAHLHPVDEPRALVVLGHGAGGSVGAPDLVATTEATQRAGCSVVLVEQPYRVAGRRSSPRPPVLDAAWLAVVEAVRADELPLVTGGRSAGARVACRTAVQTAAVAVLCLAFPLQPPRGGPDRQDELDAVQVPVLVVQGESDPFGMPAASATREVFTVPGNHGLKSHLGEVGGAVETWLGRHV
jgi:predicted alpha/beta-hydrolase family hydrolase